MASETEVTETGIRTLLGMYLEILGSPSLAPPRKQNVRYFRQTKLFFETIIGTLRGGVVSALRIAQLSTGYQYGLPVGTYGGSQPAQTKNKEPHIIPFLFIPIHHAVKFACTTHHYLNSYRLPRVLDCVFFLRVPCTVQQRAYRNIHQRSCQNHNRH